MRERIESVHQRSERNQDFRVTTWSRTQVHSISQKKNQFITNLKSTHSVTGEVKILKTRPQPQTVWVQEDTCQSRAPIHLISKTSPDGRSQRLAGPLLRGRNQIETKRMIQDQVSVGRQAQKTRMLRVALLERVRGIKAKNWERSRTR